MADILPSTETADRLLLRTTNNRRRGDGLGAAKGMTLAVAVSIGLWGLVVLVLHALW